VASVGHFDPPDLLDQKKCCQSLAGLRHARWFQAKANGVPHCVVLTRIMKDLCARCPTWKPLTSWAIEVLVQRALASSSVPLILSGALICVFKCISSGLLLDSGRGLYDPCERSATDVLEYLCVQEREDITASAQQALRMMTFNKMHEVLGIDDLPELDHRVQAAGSSSSRGGGASKRSATAGKDPDVVEAKKAKVG